jgi:hypothetical protein
MRALLRAVIQFVCEVQIYACERILENLNAERPNIDDPLADDVMPGPIDDFTGYHLIPEPTGHR